MKKNIFCLFLYFLSSFIYSQNIPFSITKSGLFQDDYKETAIVLAEKIDDNGFLLVRSYKKGGISPGEGFYIEQYDTNLKLTKEFEYEMKHPNYQKYNLVLSLFTIEKTIHIIEIYYDLNLKCFVCLDNKVLNNNAIEKTELFRMSKEEMKGTFNLQKKFYARVDEIWINDNSGTINAEDSNIKRGTFLDVFLKGDLAKDGGDASDITVVVNDTKTAFAIAMDLNQKSSDGLRIYVFNSKLEKIIDNTFTKEIKDRNYIFQNIQVSNSGDAVYLLAKSYDKDLRKKKEGGKYFFELTKIDAKNQLTQIIDPEQNFVGSLKTFFHNDELVCLGFYSELTDYRYKGICFFKFDPNSLELKKSKYNLFTEQFFFDKYGKNTEIAVKFLTFRKVFFNNNNEIILNAEEYDKTTRAGAGAGINGAMGPISSSTSYSFDDIVIAKLNYDGSMLWARNINKKQSTTDDDTSYLSYTSTVRNDKTYFFINTKDKIKKLKNDRIEFGQIRKNKSNLNVIVVNAVGDFDYQEILDDEQNEVPFMVSKGAIIDNTIYFLGRKGKDKQLLKVTL
ncbi:hypothetical protein QWY90_13765 [Flavobacterium paronense]|uniref:Uncharacterized protein n=1 Tax=Flavobacterium paronense TaxID=1392775 RepID=A0ABV5GEL6_9FLAO|nr:hypothetical protein [Flavobacterium paronense]MDN3678376.1 hypothetical protein [Flavobacterium paronense]